MQPEIVERQEFWLAGVVASGKEVSEIDIHALWDAYGQFEPELKHRVEGFW
jgi:hypothetical protein